MLPNMLCMLLPALHYFQHNLVFAAGDFMPRVFRHQVHKLGRAEVPPTIGVIDLHGYNKCWVSDCMHCTRRLGKYPSKQTLVVAARCNICTHVFCATRQMAYVLLLLMLLFPPPGGAGALALMLG
jgi:hypothetical protein